MKMYKRGLAAGLLLWLALAGAQTPSPTQRFTMNFQNVDIVVLAEAIGKATNLTFLPDPRVRAQVNLINAKPMNSTELYEAFLQILQVNNFATSRVGNIVKIVPETNIARMAGVVLPARVNANSDEFVTTIIELKNISAQQLNQPFRLMASQSSFMQAVPGTNSLIIVDRASNVVRLQKLAEELDNSGGSGVEMIELQNSNASEVVRTLTTLLAATPAEAAAGGAPKVVADDRTNSILISGDAAARGRVAVQVASLDRAVADDGNTETRYLKYARAESVANALNGQKSAVVQTTTGNAGQAAAPAAAGASGANADRTVNIQFYTDTNLLIITGPPKTRRALMSLVDAMDIPRAQVFLEAIIADVGMDKAGDLGVNWAVFSQENGKIVPGALFNAAIGAATGSPIDLAGVANIIEDPGAISSAPQGSIFGLGKLKDNGVSWAAMLRALSTNSSTNVIANPIQMTLDNQEVTLTSGQQVPFTTGQYTNSGNNGGGGGNNGSVNPFTTVQRQDVGTTLKITPQLNGSDAMTLTIDLESSELAGQVGDGNSQITNKRTFHNVVIVKDQQWIVVGGLVRDSKSGGETRVPLLSRIPILGYLFRTKNDKRTKSNLMVFIKPTIVLDSLAATKATNVKYRDLLDAQEAQGKEGKLPPPQMPALDQPAGTAPGAAAPRTSPVP